MPARAALTVSPRCVFPPRASFIPSRGSARPGKTRASEPRREQQVPGLLPDSPAPSQEPMLPRFARRCGIAPQSSLAPFGGYGRIPLLLCTFPPDWVQETPSRWITRVTARHDTNPLPQASKLPQILYCLSRRTPVPITSGAVYP